MAKLYFQNLPSKAEKTLKILDFKKAIYQAEDSQEGRERERKRKTWSEWR